MYACTPYIRGEGRLDIEPDNRQESSITIRSAPSVAGLGPAFDAARAARSRVGRASYYHLPPSKLAVHLMCCIGVNSVPQRPLVPGRDAGFSHHNYTPNTLVVDAA
ncbi:hypothetical protein L209DRAFT_134223 [Thermothelomyces heterothallicus CBS 203.75]